MLEMHLPSTKVKPSSQTHWECDPQIDPPEHGGSHVVVVVVSVSVFSVSVLVHAGGLLIVVWSEP